MPLLRKLSGFMHAYGANVGGFWWNAGSLVQLVFSGLSLSPREFAAAVCNIISPSSYLFFGHGDRGVKAGSFFGEVGTLLTVYPQLAAGNVPTCAGFALFTLAVTVNFFSGELTRAFEGSKSKFIHHTLGNPRRFGLVTAAARVPIIANGLLEHDWHIYVPFMIWFLGDISLSFSKSEHSRARRKA